MVPGDKQMSLKKSAMSAVKDCLDLKPKEKFLVLTDPERVSIGKAMFEAAQKIGAEPMMVIMPVKGPHGTEPPDPIPDMLKKVDAVIAPTTYSVSHTQARKNACKSGTRMATMPSITENQMKKGAMTADFKKVEATAKKLYNVLKRYKTCRITTKLGTDVTMGIDPKLWLLDTGMIDKPGEFGNLPGGEAFLPPSNANGTLVVDGAFAGFGKVDAPVILEMEDNFVTKISGKKAASKLEKMLKAASKELKNPKLVYNVAELGIGINPKAKIIGNALEDEKVIGTIHMAIGDNSTFGGKVRANIHLDGIVREPTIILGKNKEIMKKGKFTIKI
jgi:leucyl aminopeptidase (aminopeptidase T)